jgi:uncharacterized protein
MKFLLALLTLVPMLAWSASFDCQKARSVTEKMVCADPELSKLDEQLAQTYRSVLKTMAVQVKANKIVPETPVQLIQEQKHWIVYQRNVCEDTTCLHEAYQSRISLLKRDPSPFSDLYQTDFINQQSISYPRDFSNEILSFNQSIIDETKRDAKDGKLGKLIGINELIINNNSLGKITGCNKLIYVSGGGTAPNAYTSSGICTLQKRKTKILVKICSNEVIGNYTIEKINNTTDTSYNNLIDFANKQCGVGG